MHPLFYLVVLTSNILGPFNDPFEFEGDYGNEINHTREYVFEQVVSKEAIANNLTDSQINELVQNENLFLEHLEPYKLHLVSQAIQEDLEHGPTLKELITPSLIEKLIEKQQELQIDLFPCINFINRHGHQKLFSFFRHMPSDFLSLDKILRDKATREGRSFDLPILSSTQPLLGKNLYELKLNLLNSLFTHETLKIVKSPNILQKALQDLDTNFLTTYLGPKATLEDLTIFTTPGGQIFFYWLYQSLNLHLVAQNESMITEINVAKKTFETTLGNSLARAKKFKEKLISSNTSVLFTQESDLMVCQQLTEGGLFHSVTSQNPADGTFVFLQSDIWESSYQVIAIKDYEGYEKGRLNVILATKKESGEKFLLASSHGNSKRAEDGRLQVTKIMEKFHQLSLLPENTGIQLIIGIDANTKSSEDIKLLREHLDLLGLMATNVGATTVKKRMVTTQHSKVGRFAIDEEDYVIILKPENGGLFKMRNPTVGLKEEKANPMIALPNVENASDHYPVGVTLIPYSI